MRKAGRTGRGKYIDRIKGHYYNWGSPSDAAIDKQGNMYVLGLNEHVIYKRTSAGNVSILAGSKGEFGFADGTGSAARFNYPVCMVMDVDGNLIVDDNGNYRIRRVTPSGVVTTIAGRGWSDFADGPGNLARFSVTVALTVDTAGNIYVADWGNSAIRKITPDGVVSTLVSGRGIMDGPLLQAHIEEPTAITIDRNGNLFVFDFWHNIRMISPKGVVYTIRADRTWTYCVNSLAVGPDNVLYMGDINTWRIYKIIIENMPE